MPNVFKKFIFSFLAFLTVFLYIAPNYSTVYACVTNFECVTNPSASGCIPNPNPGPGQQTKICSTAVTTAVSNAAGAAANAAIQAAAGTAAASTGTWYNQDFPTWMQKVNDQSNPSEIFGERYTSAQVQWVIYGFLNFLLKIALPPDVVSCVFTNTVNLSACQGAIKTALIGSTAKESNLASNQQKGNLLGLVFNADRPFSGIGYIKDKINNFGLVPVAHAQVGVGYDALSTVRSIWVISRNTTYGLFVLVAIVFAFMVMFRVKISPQVVITVQSAIPKLVIALLLVTFSYAIAGLLVDLMYVVIGLLSVIIAPMIPNVAILQPAAQYQPNDVFNLITTGQFLGSTFSGGIFLMLVEYMLPLILILMILTLLTVFIPGPGIIIAAIFFFILLVVIVMCIWFSLKIIFMLFKALANIFILTIFAPIQITMGTLVPSFGFNEWLKSLVSNLSVFIVTGVLWLFSWIFMLDAWNSLFPGGNMTLPTITLSNGSNPWPPLLGIGGFGTFLLFLGVSFVLFTMIPKANELVQSMLSGKPFAYGTAIGEAVGPMGSLGKSGAGMYVSMNRDADEKTLRKGGTIPSRTLDRLLEATILRRK